MKIKNIIQGVLFLAALMLGLFMAPGGYENGEIGLLTLLLLEAVAGVMGYAALKLEHERF